jgi:hypothetical protein
MNFQNQNFVVHFPHLCYKCRNCTSKPDTESQFLVFIFKTGTGGKQAYLPGTKCSYLFRGDLAGVKPPSSR